MSVPDHFFLVDQTYSIGHYNLALHADHARFVDDVVVALHGYDANWGHLKKKPGQTHLHGHGEDSALYKFPDGTAWAVDFIGGAGGPNPTLRWGPDRIAFYTHKDWLDPADHENGDPPQPPAPSFPYPDENTTVKAFQVRVKQAYTDAGRLFPDPNDQDAFRHFCRYGYSCHDMPESQAADKHIVELRRDLGLS